ncbi:MAG: hypothetical protein ACI9E9_001935 [Reinekea sp.]|jgi:hypothetical protein
MPISRQPLFKDFLKQSAISLNVISQLDRKGNYLAGFALGQAND